MWLCHPETSVPLGNESCSFPLCGNVGRDNCGQSWAAGQSCTALLLSALLAQEGPRVSQALFLEAIKQLCGVGVGGCLAVQPFVLWELPLVGKQVDARGSQLGEKSQGTDSPAPKSSCFLQHRPGHVILQEGHQGSAWFIFCSLLRSPCCVWGLGKGAGDHGLLSLWLWQWTSVNVT